jgi:HEAT repeat protein
MIGPGLVGEEELPSLTEKLSSPDAAVRAEAAESLRELRRKAGPAENALVKLLADPAERVRIAAASALLRIAGSNNNAVTVLSSGLTSPDAAIRRAAAAAVGQAGAGAAPLISQLAAHASNRDAQ